ncbi:hypothetical protein HDE76_000650 [Rhodanobacter sp. ANJX3]|nr:hypothetical protein [Rhodanobacter sp. ANJX3]NYE27517.1 hypothetical protein [Rhodanobacter sp. K2T2]
MSKDLAIPVRIKKRHPASRQDIPLLSNSCLPKCRNGSGLHGQQVFNNHKVPGQSPERVSHAHLLKKILIAYKATRLLPCNDYIPCFHTVAPALAYCCYVLRWL